jgi:predicted acetyltransferase
MFALSVEYEARLWKFLADHDWVSRVISEETRPVDELWRDLLANRRVVYPTGHWDPLWLRVLDPAAVLGARRYDVPGRFVLRIVDKDGHADGTFAVEGGPDGATCARSTQSPDVTLPVAILSSILLGGYTASRYAALGMLEEHRDGAVAEDRLTQEIDRDRQHAVGLLVCEAWTSRGWCGPPQVPRPT